MYTSGTAKRRVARLWAKEIFLSAHNLRLREGNAEAYFRLFPGKKDRSIIGQDKGPHRLAARPEHFAPQCGAFSEDGTAPYFGGKEKIRTGWCVENA